MKKQHVALTRCYYCLEPFEILLATEYLNGEPVHDMAQYQDKCINMDPCPKCKGYMDQGIILITIDPSKSAANWHTNPNPGEPFMPNPFRAGGWYVVREEAVRRMLEGSPKMLEFAIKHRWMFIEHEAAERLGLVEAAKRAPYVQTAPGQSNPDPMN